MPTIARNFASKANLLRGPATKPAVPRTSTLGLIARMAVAMTVGGLLYVSFVVGVSHTTPPVSQHHHAKAST